MVARKHPTMRVAFPAQAPLVRVASRRVPTNNTEDTSETRPNVHRQVSLTGAKSPVPGSASPEKALSRQTTRSSLLGQTGSRVANDVSSGSGSMDVDAHEEEDDQAGVSDEAEDLSDDDADEDDEDDDDEDDDREEVPPPSLHISALDLAGYG